MYKKIALLSGILVAGLFGVVLTAQAVVRVETGSNLVNVQSCEQVGRNIRVKTSANASPYILNSSCRDAGHGLRSYNLTCTSARQYRVQWTTCGSNQNPNPDTSDTQGPVLSVSASALTNTVANNKYSYQVVVNAQDTTNNVKGVKVSVRDQATNGVVQSWWVDNRNGLSNSENGFGSTTLNRTVSKTGLQTGKTYVVTVTAYDVRGNSTTVSASNTLYIAATTDTKGPSVTGDVTYTAVWSSNQVNKVVPTLSARATDTNKVTKIVLYYTPGTGEGYRVVKTCDNLNTKVATCSYTFNDATTGYYYALAWDETNNSKGSAILSF